MTGKRVLLTGASGFVGRACIGPLRERGYDVHTITRGRRAVPDGVTAWQGDLLETDMLPSLLARIGPSHLLHLAWDVSDGYWIAAANVTWLEAGIALLDAFQGVGGRRAVGGGSCAEYGWTVARCDELAALLKPATRYGMAKLTLGRAFLDRRATAWARLFFPFGPGDRPQRLIPSVIDALLAGREAACTDGLQVRDFLYIDDVGTALAALLESEVEGPVNIGSGEGVPVRDVVLRIAAEIGRPELVRLGALPMRPDEPSSLVAVTERLRREVGFQPAVDLEAGIRLTVAAMRHNRDHPQ